MTKPKSILWNIWQKHPALGLLNIGRTNANDTLSPETVVDLWAIGQRRMNGAFWRPAPDVYAKPYSHTALDNYGN